MAGIANVPPLPAPANVNNPQAPDAGRGGARGRGRGNRGNRGRGAAAQGGNASANPGRGGPNNPNGNGAARGGNRGARRRPGGRGALTHGPGTQQARGRGTGAGQGNHKGPPTNIPNCAPHPNGQYWIRVQDVANIYNDPVEVPLRCFPNRIKRRNDWVNSRDVIHALDEHDDEASYRADQEDGASILREIDTGFGICPGGGLLDVSGYGSD